MTKVDGYTIDEVVGNDNFGENGYLIGIGEALAKPFLVYGYTEEDALDSLVDHCEQEGYAGLYNTIDELTEDWSHEDYTPSELEDLLDEFVVAGNNCHYVTLNLLKQVY